MSVQPHGNPVQIPFLCGEFVTHGLVKPDCIAFAWSTLVGVPAHDRLPRRSERDLIHRRDRPPVKPATAGLSALFADARSRAARLASRAETGHAVVQHSVCGNRR
jgi:hypothetical protein